MATPRGSRPAGRAGCGCRTGRGTPVSTPHGCWVGLGEVDAAGLERLVLGLDVVGGEEERADRALGQQLAQLRGDLGREDRLARDQHQDDRGVGLGGRARRRASGSRRARAGRASSRTRPAHLVHVEGEGLVLIVDPDLCVGDGVHGEQITVAARACLLESCAPGLAPERLRVSPRHAGGEAQGLLCLSCSRCVRAGRRLRWRRLADDDRPRRQGRRAEGAQAADQRVRTRRRRRRRRSPRASASCSSTGSRKHPEWRLDLNIIGGNMTTTEQARLLEKARVGTAPDCANVDSFTIPLFIEQGVLAAARQVLHARRSCDDLFPNVAQGDDRARTATSTPGGGRPTCASSTAAPTSSRRRRRPGTS